MTRRAAIGPFLLAALSAAASVEIAAAAAARPAIGAAPTTAQLRGAVTAALYGNRRLSAYDLWTNRIPANATESTRGPALAAMRASAETRRQQHIRVRMLHDHFHIISITLNRSRAAATAVVEWDQDVAPSYADGRRRGRAIEIDERARLLLHRVGRLDRFVVWEVSLLA